MCAPSGKCTSCAAVDSVVAFVMSASRNVHNPGVSMRRATVDLYCAVVGRFELLVSTRAMAAREPQAAFNRRAASLCAELGALNLGSGEGRQREPESGAVRLVGTRPKFSAVRINDGPADRQANSQAAGL